WACALPAPLPVCSVRCSAIGKKFVIGQTIPTDTREHVRCQKTLSHALDLAWERFPPLNEGGRNSINALSFAFIPDNCV
ncbi:hypothetical protein AVEN_272198-1, partial [Araneus ventricosus]